MARETTLSKWRAAIATGNQTDIAQAIRDDLRVREGRLSFWGTDGTEPDIEYVATALASASDFPDTVVIPLIDVTDVVATGVTLEPTAGRTPLRAARDRHLDVLASHSQTEEIAKLILNTLQADQEFRVTRSKIIRLVAETVQNGEIAMLDLSPHWQRAIERRTAKA